MLPNPLFQKGLLESFRQEDPRDFPPQSDGTRTYPALTLSGGGANGAYGAGLLNGWSEEGSRPVFKIVTGVSTGALIAPMVFLGSEYDGKLKEFYTTISSKDIFKKKGILGIIGGNSLASTKPLAHRIAKGVDESFLQAVADAHSQGRRLYIGTTNLDSQRLVVWDMGAIASSGDKGALELFRKIMLASASIPVIFPPVYIDVEADHPMAEDIVINAKTQRPGVCNAVETLLVHEAIAPTLLPSLLTELQQRGVEIRGCEKTQALGDDVVPATEEDWDTEHLDLILSVKVLEGYDEALTHIERYSSRLTEAIITNNYTTARRFLREVDSACVCLLYTSSAADE